MKHTCTIPAATLALCLLTFVEQAPAHEPTAAIRPFHDFVPQAGFASLRKRIAQTRWPDKGTVSGQAQCAQSTKLEVLVHDWGTNYWRNAEGSSTIPRYITMIEVDEDHA